MMQLLLCLIMLLWGLEWRKFAIYVIVRMLVFQTSELFSFEIVLYIDVVILLLTSMLMILLSCYI
jgi:hypothetical protein